MQAAGRDQINRGYARMPGKIASSLAARGFGRSGKLGTAMYDTEASRLGDLSQFQSQIAQMILNRQQQGASLGESLLASGRGVTSTGPDTSAANGLMSAGNGLSNLSTLLMLQKVLKG